MGCKCDGGFTGPDCSQKICKYGADPLYYDDYQNIRYANFTYQIYTLASTTITGNYSLVFVDRTGEDWQTGPIDIAATCDAVTAALESLPNNVIPKNSVRCFQDYGTVAANTGTAGVGSDPIAQTTSVTAFQSSTGIYIGGSTSLTSFPKYTLAFSQNPGKIAQLKINKFLDGNRPTLYTAETSASTLGWHIYSNGFTGEDVDLVPDLCEGVLVTLTDPTSAVGYYHQLTGLTVQSTKALKRCLGSSENITTNNVEVYNWDYGSIANPHLIKLIDATQDYVASEVDLDRSLDQFPKTTLCPSTKNYIDYPIAQTTAESAVPRFDYGWCSNRNPPGFYAVVYFDGTLFRILTRAAADYLPTTTFHVYTTTGWLNQVSTQHFGAMFDDTGSANSHNKDTAAQFANQIYGNTIRTFTINAGSNDPAVGDVSCESIWQRGSDEVLDCLNKGDRVMLINTAMAALTYTGTYYQQPASTLKVNPIYPDIYTVQRISREPRARGLGSLADPFSTDTPYANEMRNQIVLDYGVNAGFSNTAPATIYKFYPPATAEKGYKYVEQCSNRGLCDTTTGLCQCMPGYTGDNCGVQNALAA